MRYLLDTNACIALLNDTSPPLAARLRRDAPANIGLPAPVAYELYYGACKSRQARRNLELLDRMAFEIVPFDAGRMPVWRARSALSSKRWVIRSGPYDLLIAGQARARARWCW